MHINKETLNPHLLEAEVIVLVSPIYYYDINAQLKAVISFQNMTEYLDWQIVGTVIGVDCGDVDTLKKTNFAQEAYELGKNL